MKNLFFTYILLSGSLLMGQEKFIVDDCLQLKGIVTKNTKIYANPDESSYSRSVAEKFSTVFMFEHEDSDEAVMNGFYRIGKNTETPTGYISSADLVAWNHRLCLGFTDLVGRSPSLIYNTIEEAQGEDWDSNKKPNKKAIGQEPTIDKTVKYDMLLPVLEERNIERKGSNSQNMMAYKVGYLGQTGEASTIKRPSADKKTSLDLMFLIDATGSMAEEIEGAKRVVSKVTNKLKTMSNTEVRLGISLYKDYGDDFVTRKWQGLTKDYDQIQRRLAEVEVSMGGDAAEAMYQGVKQTINSTNWNKGEQAPVLRVILIIGDAPGHEYGGSYDVDKDDLITEASESRVRFIALKINTGEVSYDLTHKAQMKDLVDGLHDGDRGLYLEANAYTGRMTEDYLQKLAKSIEVEIERLKELEGYRSGAIKLEDVTPTNRAIFIKNLTSSGFDDIGVHFNQGWTTQYNSDGQTQVESYVYMTYNELNTYKWYCQTAIAAAQSTDEKIATIMTDKVRAMTGEEFDADMDLNDHLQKALCLPSSNSGILKFSLNDIVRYSAKRKESLIQNMDDKVKALDDIIRNPDLWRKPDGTDLKYTFVPIDLMP